MWFFFCTPRRARCARGNVEPIRLQERARRAEEIRKKFYAGKEYRELWAGAGIAAASIETVGDVAVTKIAAPCTTQNAGWIAAVASKALSLAIVVSSIKVPEYVGAERLRRCGLCPHSTVRGRKHYCGCCGCPKWNVGRVDSALEYKDTKAGWFCPRTEPAFGQWSLGNDGLEPPFEGGSKAL